MADARYADDLSVDDLAAAAGYSRSHFSRAFRATYGESPHQYLLTRRMERAAALLRTTDRSVAEICTDVGLSSIGSFTVSFRRVHGATPTQYRASRAPAEQFVRLPACVAMAYGRRANPPPAPDAPSPPAAG